MGKARLGRSSTIGEPAQLALLGVASQELRTVANYIDEYRSMAGAGEITPAEAVDLASLKAAGLRSVLDLAVDGDRVP